MLLHLLLWLTHHLKPYIKWYNYIRGDRTYTPDELEHKIKYVNHGCYEDSETFYNMLHEAYDTCKAEVDSELGNFDQFEDGE